jgi:inner membrane protein
MDPITQTILGATAALALARGGLGRRAAIPGAVGGEIPDIDLLLPGSDPALPMEFHRHFTHALCFVPAGGLLAAAPLLLLPRWRRDWKAVLAAATVGCATHGLLDSCTTYGTHLLWPFSHRRVAWDIVSIVDPVFTVVLATGLLWALCRRSAWPARAGLCLCLAWLGLGALQHGRAEAAQARVAAARGHEPLRGRVMPTLGNIIVWRSIYEAGGALHADAIRAGPGPTTVREGEAIAVLRLQDLPPQSRASPRVLRVLWRFARFADGYVAPVPGEPRVVGDMRYSRDAGGFAPLWGIEIDADGVTWASLPRWRKDPRG